MSTPDEAGAESSPGSREGARWGMQWDRFDEPVAVVQRDGRIVYANPRLLEVVSDAEGSLADGVLLPADRADFRSALAAALSAAETRTLAVRLAAPSSRPSCQLKVVPMHSGAGAAALLLFRRAEEPSDLRAQVERAEARFRILAEHLPDFAVYIDRNRTYLWVNRVAPGLRKEDVIGHRIDDFTDPNELEAMRAAVERCFATREISTYVGSTTLIGGKTRWFNNRIVPLPPDAVAGERALLLTAEITEQREAELARLELEDRLHQAQRMESLGQLAGGVAHDFNNLLSVIAGHAELLEMDIANGKLSALDLAPILETVGRAADLTRQLLALGRRQRIEQVSVDVRALLERQVAMLRRLIPERIRIACDLGAEPRYAAVDPGQFEQVVMNLCVNARDAISATGTISLGVESIVVTEAELTTADLALAGRFVRLSVSDDGAGMTEAQRARVFEPFFTTKSVGEGSGLGLAVVDGIVKQHGGFVRCRSRVGRGTTFEVYWPAADGSQSAAVATQRPPPPSGAGRVLLAEDEEALREVTARMLRIAGYGVTAVADGTEALTAVTSGADLPYDLLVLDAVMPGASGYDVFLAARARRSDLPVVFATGYAGSALPADVQSQPRVAVVAKPYRRATILAVIAHLLGAQAEHAR